MALGLSVATLVALFVESVLFGVFNILFAATMFYLFGKRKVPNNAVISSVLIAMYVLALGHVIVDLQRVIEGFTVYDSKPGGPDAYFSNVGSTSYIVKQGFYDFQTILGDAFMIYRVFVIYGRDKRILILGAIWMVGNMFLAIYGLVALSHLSTATPIFIQTIKRMALAFYSITLGVNTICTGMIALRIWLIERQMAGVYRSRTLSPAMAALVESAALYCAALVALIATYASNSWGHYPVFDAIPQLIGIVFSMIIVRIALGRSHEGTIGDRTSSTRRNTSRGSGPFNAKLSTFRAAPNYRGESMEMTVSDTLGSRGEADIKNDYQLDTIIHNQSNEVDRML